MAVWPCHNPDMLSTFVADAKFALRQLRRSPGFAVSTIITLAFGIGATTAIFTLVDGILLRPLPFPDRDRLVALDTLEFPPGVPTNTFYVDYSVGTSYPNFFDWQHQNHTFDSIASYQGNARLIAKANGEGAQVLGCGRVSANLFPTLGISPELGRNFTPEEELPGHRVVVLSHELWVSLFASSPDVIGQIVRISDQPSTVVGVMPAGFHYPVQQPAYFWATYAANAEGQFPLTSRRDDDELHILGRLRPGVSIEQASADLNTIQRQLAQQYPENRYRPAVLIQPLLKQQIGDSRNVLFLLLASVGAVLLIGCANVAGLILARATSRNTEIAVRTALGASRIRVVRQLLIESLILAVCGGVIGILASILFVRGGIQLVPKDIPRLFNVSIDWRILLFSVLLSGLTALIFGLLPAWRISRSDPANALRDGGATTTPGRRRNRLQHTLVVAETALGFTLLIGSGLLIRSMLNLLHLDPGFDFKQTVHFDVALTQTRYPDPGKVPFFRKLLPELAAVPGVTRVSAGHQLPGRGGTWIQFTIPGHLDPPDNIPTCNMSAVLPGFFETLSIPLLHGRTFSDYDNLATSPPVAIVSRAFVRKYFPNEDPVGHYLTPKFEYSTEPIIARQIIGVVGDTLGGDPWDDPYTPRFYLPYAQNPTHQRPVVVMKVSGDPLSYQNAVRAVVQRFDADAPAFDYETFGETLREMSEQPRFEAALVSTFAAVALLLSALGLYAVLSYVIAERMRELALRMAFGAKRSDIVAIVLRRALLLGAVGILTGAFASFLATRLVADFLFGVKPFDPSTFVAVTITLLLVSIASALAPAVRAASLDPMRTLHEQ
ncbi:MAG TPA: ABC transporter permease [Candidatus Sulfotelmatobacter sp.]|nr:ABC transporter permease [Candidatus Sulfotelmatobacter sp.]